MNKKSFKDKWNDLSNLDKFRYITYFILLIIYLIILVYYAYFTPIIKNMFKIMIKDRSIPFIWGVIGAIATALGLIRMSYMYYYIVETIFYPETDLDKFIKTKKREVFNKYPIKIAKLKLDEEKLKYKLNTINEEIKEIQNE